MSAARTLVVRADASTAIGTGHVMRSLALADAWRASGGRVVFLSHCPPLLAQRIRRSGLEIVLLEQPETGPADLARRLAPLVESDQPPTWVALDGYGFDTACQQAVRALGARLLVIDDLAHLARYEADLLVNPNLKAQQIDYVYEEGATLALGARYVFLRPEFQPWIGRPRHLRPVARNVLVALGGSDPANVSGVVLEGLAMLGNLQLHARVVVGPANPHLVDLRRRAAASAGRVELVIDPAGMPELMAWADLAVTAAGTTCWELALMQLPALAVVVAANQYHAAATLAEAGVVEHLGRSEELAPRRVAEAVWRLCGDIDRRRQQAAAGAQLVDGRGAQRVVAVMQALDAPLADDQLTLRFARPDDLMPLLRLSNEPSVRRSSLNSDTITLDEHTQWFTQRLLNPAVRMWVLEYQGVLVAHIRYVRVDPTTVEISLAVVPAFRRRGLARKLLATCDDACEDLRASRLRAVVRVENHASLATFRRAGFRQVDSREVAGQACHIFEREQVYTRNGGVI